MDIQRYKVIAEAEEAQFQIIIICMAEEYKRHLISNRPCRNSALQGHDYIIEIINGHGSRCQEMFRMEKHVFLNLCDELTNAGTIDSRYLSIQEQVAMFLYILAHNERYRVVAERFQHSGWTVSKYFHTILMAICKLGKRIITPPNLDVVPPEILHDPKAYPYFKNCVGAIDGTHVSAWVPSDQQIPYRGRKSNTTTNVMAACSFDMRFTFVMAGWEGTANDARVFRECVENDANKFPRPPEGKYYLVDSGYTNLPGYLTPYRGERYHMQEYRLSRRRPRGREELFNFRHSSLRNVIERCFGVLKMRYPILKLMPPFDLDIQKYIVITCCTLHNFIRMQAQQDKIFMKYGRDGFVDKDQEDVSTHRRRQRLDLSQNRLREANELRDSIANAIWNDVNE